MIYKKYNIRNIWKKSQKSNEGKNPSAESDSGRGGHLSRSVENDFSRDCVFLRKQSWTVVLKIRGYASTFYFQIL